MPKRPKPTADAVSEAAGRGKRQRKIQRLERRLSRTTEMEARRAHQLDSVRDRRAALETALAALRSPAPDARPRDRRPREATTEPGSGTGPQAFCLRERRMVALLDPAPFRMKNGRAAVTGHCASCGARVTTTARAMVAAHAGAVPAAT